MFELYSKPTNTWTRYLEPGMRPLIILGFSRSFTYIGDVDNRLLKRQDPSERQTVYDNYGKDKEWVSEFDGTIFDETKRQEPF